MKGLFGIVGESKHTQWKEFEVQGLEQLLTSGLRLEVDAIKYFPMSTLDNTLYPDFAEFLKTSPYLRSNLEKINDTAATGNISALRSHISNIRAEFRELRFQSYANNNGHISIFYHSGPVNEAGIDAITKKGNAYYLVEVKDRGGGSGNILDGFKNPNNPLEPKDLNNYFKKEGGAFVFDRGYFEDDAYKKYSSGEIMPSEYHELLGAGREGRINVLVFAGGTNNLFNATLRALDRLINPDGKFFIPFIKVLDR